MLPNILLHTDLVDTQAGNPVRRVNHLGRPSANPLEVDDSSNAPLGINEDVSRVEVGELRRKGPC